MKFRHILRARRALRVAALGVVLALAPSAAWPQVFEPGDAVTPVGKNAGQHKITIDEDGNVWIAYEQNNGARKTVFVAKIPEGGGVTIERISALSANASNPDIDVSPAGVSAVTFKQTCGGTKECIKVCIVSAEGEPGVVKSVSLDGSEPGVTTREEVDLFWRRQQQGPSRSQRAPGDHRIQTRSLSAAGVLGAVKNISPADGDAFAPRVVADADGNLLFVWLHDDGEFLRVQARSLSASGVLGPIQDISPAGADADHPQVAMTSDGKAVIVWQRFNATFSESVIETRTRSPAGALGAIVPLSSPGTYAVEPQVALDAAGDALFIWERQALPNSRVQARHLSAAGVLKPIQNITAATGFASAAQVARSPAGEAVIIWTRNTSGGNIAVQTRTRADAGPLGPIQTLSNGPIGTTHPFPRVAINDAGEAVAVWGRYDGSNNRLWVAFADP